MPLISLTTLDRLIQLCEHPKAGMNIHQCLAMCAEHGISLDDYVATLTMQLALIDAVADYSKVRREAGENQALVMRAATAACANAVAWLTVDEPIPGADVASTLANDAVYAFASFLAPRIVYTTPSVPKPPTHDAPTSRQ